MAEKNKIDIKSIINKLTNTRDNLVNLITQIDKQIDFIEQTHKLNTLTIKIGGKKTTNK